MDKADRITRLMYRVWPPKERQKMRGLITFKSASGEVTKATTAYIPLPNPRHEKKAPAPRQSKKSVRTRSADHDELVS